MIEIIAYILSIIGYLFFVLSCALKKKNQMLITQNGNHLLNGIAQAIMQGYSGMIQDIISFSRNIFILFNKNNKILSFIFIALGLSLGIIFNNNGWLGLLPVISSLIYSIIVLFSNNVIIIKTAICFSNVCWAIYCYAIVLYTGLIFNVIALVFSIISLAHCIIKRNNRLKAY